MVNAGAVIQVRSGSERLPGKALLPLPFSSGPSMLEHVVARAQQAKAIQQVIVATTDQPSDDAIAAFCQRKGLPCFRGAAEDVLDRFFQAANKYRLDVVVRLTGDNPFIMPETIDYAVQKHSEARVDYSITEGLPLGTNVEVVSFAALQKAASSATELTDREHVTPYIRRVEGFKTQALLLASPVKFLRLTVDYPTDYALASLLYGRLYHQNSLFDFAEIAQVLQENRWLSAINADNTQRKAFASEAEELERAKQMLKAGGFSRVLQKLEENL
ncbi:glycosyltransferase family protein [Pontibacter sp. 172403-2]|uniref:cytidylyltransferase domain-containing protein n=1 Tax=Pontibacter rufus TaxID=2791028 RepID=UPI0018AF71A7|nr:glycosyltransferase family protein [Pontibacter sp. 172403-2]MBF9253778.1 glycosyltransferase family protein [Pontibacter sp. 172403-2]